jgi:formate C-acetyltransferase
MSESSATSVAPSRLWGPAPSLSPRVRKLREEYFSFRDRPYFRNEVMPFGTGKPWDVVYTPHSWSVVPEVFPFMPAFEDSLAACARVVPFPDAQLRDPLALRRARFFAEVVERHLPVQILEGELIVGGQFNTALSLTLTKAEAARFREEERSFLAQVSELNDLGVGNCGAVPGHIIPGYAKALRVGLRGLVVEIEALPADGDHETTAFRNALVVCAQAARHLAGRYAVLAERLADSERDPQRWEELREIARICRKVPWEPAETLHEALQALWFIHMLVMAAESYPGPGLSPGRIDQYLYPYYRRDLDSGRLDRARAKELCQCWWLKPNYAYDYQGRVGNNQGITAGFGQLVTLGGIDAQGGDASNDLTWLLLEVIEEMNLLEPKPNIRLHAKTPPALLRRVADLIARAQGSPFLLNFDEHSIRGLEWQGLPKERLWDYAPVGCLENTLQGDDRSGTVDVNLNLAKAVELTLFDGQDLATGRQIGPRTGDPARFTDFAAFQAAFLRQLRHLVEWIIRVNNRADEIRARWQPTPFLSLLVDGCARRGKDVTAGGAEHNYLTVEGVAFATTVDSLAAVRKLVFEEKRLEMGALLEAIRANFEGHEKVRSLLANKAPKYGNDDDAADALAREVSRFWTREVFRHQAPATGKRYRAGYLSWNYWVAYAPKTAATPDGRPRGKFLSNGSCPVASQDRHGPTANALSVGKIGLESAPSGDSHTLSLSPSLLRDDEHLEKLAAFLRAYGEAGGTALQVNVIDPATLREAQANPFEYRNLLVRVTGYNAYFVTLGQEIQNEIIAREAHALT